MNAPEPDGPVELEDQLAAQALDATDLDLLAQIRTLYATADPVPPGLVERIQFELTLDALHAELATLTQLDLSSAGARSQTEEVRTITFTSDSLTTMVTVAQEDDTVRVDGWAVPGAGIRVEVLLVDGARTTVADDDGRFVFDAVPNGLARFVLHVGRGDQTSTVMSPTIEL